MLTPTPYAVIVAGGSGLRMNAVAPKQFLLLRGKPLLWYTLTAFLQAFHNMAVILVLPQAYLEAGKAIIDGTSNPGSIRVATGGPTRFHSVQNGLQHVPAGSVTGIHDGVRCLVTPDLIQRCYHAAIAQGNAIPAVAAIDSVRLETPSGSVTADRGKVRLVQTPQVFHSDVLKAAYRQPFDEAFTDDASVVEKWGEKIHLVEGEATNIKITRPIDLLIAGSILEEREKSNHNTLL